MFSQVLHRFLHTCISARAVEKAALLELRKKTGYTFTNCKKALEATDNDIKKAEKWLVKEAKKQGWASMGRGGTQGLVAVHVEGPFAAMAEVNCETDFVARTDEFRQFAEKLVRSCVSHSKKLPSLETAVTKLSLGPKDVENLRAKDGHRLSEARALAAGKLGENVAVRRVLCLRAERALVAGFCHAIGESPSKGYPCFGKYGALVAYRALSDCSLSEEELENLGRGLCQQVVGLRPTSVGLLEDFMAQQNKVAKEDDMDHKKEHTKDQKDADAKEGDQQGDHQEDQEVSTQVEEEKEDSRLLFQDYVLEPDMKVGTLVAQSDIDIMDFERFECGETLES